MATSSEDDAHTTLGRRFRTPAHPDVLAALGRALYNFLSLEETVTAILYEAEVATLPITRAKMAGDKETALQDLADMYRNTQSGSGIAEALDAAVAAFRQARQSIRNELSHAHPFTAGTDAEGSYMPGLAHTRRMASRGQRQSGPTGRASAFSRIHAGPRFSLFALSASRE